MKNNTLEIKQKFRDLLEAVDIDEIVADIDDGKGTQVWDGKEFVIKAFDSLMAEMTQHHQDELREVYREILDKAPGFSINGGEKQLDLPTLEYVARIEALAQTRGIDLSDKN